MLSDLSEMTKKGDEKNGALGQILRVPDKAPPIAT
jgi:hypothetical protein